MSTILKWCEMQDVFSKGEGPTSRTVRRAQAEDMHLLLTIIEQEYVAFRLHHANAHTVDSPEGFGRRFREWMASVLEAERFIDLAREEEQEK